MDPCRVIVERLAATAVPPSLFNLYRGDDAGSLARRHNLSLYLRLMRERRPGILLVGEAPGHRGGRVTGVPFTSETILQGDPAPFGLFGPSAGFLPCAERGLPTCEATATILWNTLSGYDELPLLWNACPFHPHLPGSPASNRPPTASELELGRGVMGDLMTLFGIGHVIAVGNKAAAALSRWGIPAPKIRHPGHGGKAAFQRELDALLCWTGPGD